MKKKERVSVQQQHFFTQLACNLRCVHNDQKPYSYLKINSYGGIYRKDIFMHFIGLSSFQEVHNEGKTVSLILQVICTAAYYFKLCTVICIRVYFHSQRVPLPVLVRTLMIASKPVCFSTSFRRSRRNCGLSAASWERRAKANAAVHHREAATEQKANPPPSLGPPLRHETCSFHI